ncbi:MAG: membrane protein insertion efficiency factor YidD [Candidatus Moranbacteria bacterium]|nr:membrane protein insertion efficiency factor YidD [Candidatus Moranbacteria bacterium]
MKTFLLKTIKLYQKILSRDTGWLSSVSHKRTCRFHPTCSQYAYEAIGKYGSLKGSWMGVKRILRCHPWNEGGIDPVDRGKLK